MLVTHPQQVAENRHDPPPKLNFEYFIFKKIYNFFPYNYAYSIQFHVQHKICLPVLISKNRSLVMYYSYSSILNIDSMNIDTIYNKRHCYLPYVAYWLGQIASTDIGVNIYICPHFLN